MLSVFYAECRYAECRYTECHNAECRYTECHYAERRHTECRGTKSLLNLRKISKLIPSFVSKKYIVCLYSYC